MIALNATHGLWARTDPALSDVLIRPDEADIPNCCWNFCASVSPVKAPRPLPGRLMERNEAGSGTNSTSGDSN